MPSTFHLDPPPGFCGLNSFEDIEIYTRHLPHWRQKGATYFVTFRLADSLPKKKLEELKQIKIAWQRELDAREAVGKLTDSERKEAWERLARITFEKAERWLDQGMGSCALRDAETRQFVVDALKFYDDEQYELGCYVVMPNHAHLVIRPHGDQKLENILAGRKRKMSRDINHLREKTGRSPWQEESYDRIVRDAAHLWRCIQYIGNNPKKANLKEGDFAKWIRPDWEELGWRFLE